MLDKHSAGRLLTTATKLGSILEVALFVTTTGLLSFLAQTNRWLPFSIILGVSTFLFIVLTLAKTKPLLTWLEKRSGKQHHLLLRTEHFGIADIFNMQVFEEQEDRNRETRRIIQEGATFSLASLTAASYIDPGLRRHWDSLKAKLAAGSPVRILVQDPFCREKLIRDQLNTAGTRPDSKFRFDLLATLHNNYSNVTIRFTSSNIYCALFFSEKEMIYDPYHLGRVEDRIENYFIAFRIVAQGPQTEGHSYYEILRSHFDNLWSKAESIDLFWSRNEHLLAQAPSAKLILLPR